MFKDDGTEDLLDLYGNLLTEIFFAADLDHDPDLDSITQPFRAVPGEVYLDYRALDNEAYAEYLACYRMTGNADAFAQNVEKCWKEKRTVLTVSAKTYDREG